MDLKDICIPIKREVNELDRIMQSNLHSPIPFVEDVIHYVTDNGGKRLRPVLTILAAKLSGYEGDAAISLGVAIEFMHTATLLHDDVIDGAMLRRGRASINKKWGNHISVLVGDFFYCRAMDMLVKHGDLRVLRVITDAITTTTEGEIFEITKSNNLTTTEDDYLQIIHGKTAALIGAACHCGGILGRLSENYEQALKNFGVNLGIAFQLIDDVLDYTSDEVTFGKTQGIDLREGKLTLPLILVLKRATEEEKGIIKNALVADEIEESLFGQVAKIIHKYDGIRETNKLAQSYVQKAKDSLSPFKPTLEKETLMAITDYVVLRHN